MNKKSEKKSEDRSVIDAFYSKKAFVKIRQCLEIGKVQFSFVDAASPKTHIDCYMLGEEFGALLMASIKNGSLIKSLIAEKAKGEQYPKAVWQSPVGGNATGNNGKPISRYFVIAPGAASEVLLTAYSYPATRNDTGAFIKVKGSSPLSTIRVPCSFNDLKILAYKWGFLENDYMSKKYCLENMKSDYAPSSDDTYVSEENGAESLEEADEYTNDPSEDDIPYVEATSAKDPSSKKEKEKMIEQKMNTIRLVATSALIPIEGKDGIKVCHVTKDGMEKRLICLTNRIADEKKFNDFEAQLRKMTSAGRSLTFSASVAEKGNDLYLKQFA